MFKPERVVVTGLGIISPLGVCVKEFWDSLLQGKSGVKAIENMDIAYARTRIAAQITNYDSNLYFTAKEAQRLSRTSQLAVVAANEAIEDAKLNATMYMPEDVGVILGSSIGGFSAVEPYYERFFNERASSPFIVPVVMNNAPASNISLRFGFKGHLMTVDAACASSAHAIGYAYNLIRMGMSKICITGGADSALSPGLIQAWSSLRALSERNENPSEACRPFSKDRDGIVLGEGAAVLVLESASSAMERNARIYGEIIGYGATSDSFHLTQPSIEGPVKAMQRALADANLSTTNIDYINAHATATFWNDKTETEAIKKVFDSHAYMIPVVGIKGAIGHSIGASSAIEFLSCLLSIRDNIVPPTINLKVPDPDCDLDYVKEGKRPYTVTHVMSNSFAFGGSNSVLIASKYVQ